MSHERDEARPLIEAHWDAVRDLVRDHYQQLTEDDLQRTGGRYDRVVDTIEARTGHSPDEIARTLDELTRTGLRYA